MNEHNKSFTEAVDAMEQELANHLTLGVQADLNIVREHLSLAVTICSQTISPPKSFSALLDAAMANQKGRREAAILMVRALSIDNLIPFSEDTQLERKVCALIEAGFADQCGQLDLSDRRQTFKKLRDLGGLHEQICRHLQLLRELPTSLEEIDKLRSEIQKAIKSGQSGAYLQPFGWTAMRAKISNICEQISELVACKDTTFKARFDRVNDACEDLARVGKSPSFLCRDYITPYAESIAKALRALESGATDQFKCSIEPRRKGPLYAEKRYPLHQANKMLTITIPMVNSGPGMAVDVSVELDCGSLSSIALDSEEIHLGEIPPGEFAIAFKALVVEPAESVSMAVQVSWNEVFGESKSTALTVKLAAQNPSVDWKALEQLDPFSLEVADADRFIGRNAKVLSIASRLLKPQMSSTYITGQKRIGKTSLAKAVLRYVQAEEKPPTSYETCYLEWGEFATADAKGTLKALGEEVYVFLKEFLPSDVILPAISFDGTIAPLNAVLKAIETHCPTKRFILVLDEFDELHPELYRFGPLAEAFFANLRTLAARKNLAFILVGGEKMPFIIGAQGDQLNKFVREGLDYFNRSDEWNDYVQLVTGPTTGSLNWEDSALNELFTATNGHPYYTKLLCAKIFSTAIAQRDTEILVRDVRHALNGRVSELDTNAFAHFWKDGINAEREEEEIIELKRLRLLTAFGRALWRGTATRETVAQEIAGTKLKSAEVGPLVEDFCRRDIMEESGGVITTSLPIFQRWLVEVGVTKLISSTLADDLEVELQKAREIAYVTSTEVQKLAKSWPLYRGREVTGESIRAWLDQVSQPEEQRLLFNILEHLRFVTTAQIGEYVRTAHKSVVARAIPPWQSEIKFEKRRDIVVTYLGAPGKSGAAYARIYAKENGILLDSVWEPEKVVRRIAGGTDRPNALVVVDDFAGTGRTVGESVDYFLSNELAEGLRSRAIPMFIVLLFATKEAEEKIESVLNKHAGIAAQIYVCNNLTDEFRAFPEGHLGFWMSENERDRAKALCVRIGSVLFKEALGVGGQAILIAFPETCPNNNLPIIFASGSGKMNWNPLLPRPAS
jgi:hypothetical protein